MNWKFVKIVSDYPHFTLVPEMKALNSVEFIKYVNHAPKKKTIY